MAVQLACSTTTFGRLGARTAVERIRDFGIDAVQLYIHTQGTPTRWNDEPLITDQATPAELNAVERLLEARQVRVPSCQVHAGNPLQQGNLALVKRKIEIAARLGARKVVGNAGQAMNRSEYEELVGRLREIGDFCGAFDVTFCCNILPGVCQNHRQALRTLGDVNHPHVRLNFDPGNLLYYNEDPIVEVALAKCCHLVQHVHLKDSMGEQGHWYFPALGYGGAVDFLRVYQIMRDCGFNGPFSINLDGIEGEIPDLHKIETRLRDSLTTLEECGYFNPTPERVDVL